MPVKRLLVLALDAANADWIESWAADGTLPNLARLMSVGLFGPLRGVDGFYVGATWPSFYTAVNPARHGIYWLWRLKQGTYRLAQSAPEDFGTFPALWEVLSDAGKRCIVLDVPLSRMAPGLNGIQAIEWGVHDAAFGFQASPGIEAEILGTVGRHPAPANCDAVRTELECRAFAAQLVAGAAARARLTARLLEQQPWDFALQVFSETHCAGHQLWHTHDPRHPGHRPGGANLVREVYQAVDRAVGDILAAVGPGTTVAVVALHGMAHTTGASRLLHSVLARLGMTAPAASELHRGSRPNPRRVLAAAWRSAPERIRQALRPLRARFGPPARDEHDLPIDPGRSRCFYLDTGFTVSAIRLNLRGRDPQGIVTPGGEARALTKDLTDALMALVDPASGRPVVRSVRATADLMAGERLADLPDLLVEWDDADSIGSSVIGDGSGALVAVSSPRTGRIERVNDNCRSGEHRRDGFLLVTGPGVTAGRLHGGIHTLDLAPTFAAMLGVAFGGADGSPIGSLTGQAAPEDPG